MGCSSAIARTGRGVGWLLWNLVGKLGCGEGRRELNRRDDTIRLLLLRWKNEDKEGPERRAI